MNENEDTVLFRISRLEKRIRNIELSEQMMPIYCMDVSNRKFLTKYYNCYRSKPLLKVTFNLNGGGATQITLNGKNYTFESAVMCVCLPMKKGSNRADINTDCTDGQIILEVFEGE